MAEARERRAGVASGRLSRDLPRLAYLGVLALATLSSLRWDLDGVALRDRLARMLAPSVTARDAIDAARNVVLFAGWGLVWVLTAPAAAARRALRDAVLTGAAVSLGVELVQALSWTRRASVLDVATNTTGALAGALAVVLAQRVLARRRERRSLVGLPALVFAGSYGAAALGEALVPLFRQWPVPGAWGGPVRRLAVTASRFEWSSLATIPLTDLAIFLPAGALAVAALVEEGVAHRAAARWTAGAGVALAVLAELGHGPLGLEMVAGAALTHGLAVAGGALLAARLLPPATRRWRGAARPRLLTAAYAILLLLWALRPYVPVTDAGAVAASLRGEWWVPLRSLAQRMDMFSVIDVLNGFLLYLPAGALLAVWPMRRRGPMAGVLPAVYLAAGSELAQLLVAGRTLDITDALVQMAGAAVGWILVRRAGFRPHGTQRAASA